MLHYRRDALIGLEYVKRSVSTVDINTPVTTYSIRKISGTRNDVRERKKILNHKRVVWQKTVCTGRIIAGDWS